MAVPATVNLKNLSGVYTLNKTLSDSSDKLLLMQNVGWIVRQAVYWSNVEYTITEYTDDAGKLHIDTIQVSTGGQRNDEHWVVDGDWSEKTSHIWGEVKSKFNFVKLSEIEDGYLKEGWEQAIAEGEVLMSNQESRTDTWKAVQVIGFAEVDGERRHVRRILGTKGDQTEYVRMVYDWKSELPAAESEAAE